ncbi:MAG: hypothetical protein IJB84_04675 [Lachnospiraceae bacterium]|nr:hypothetical protein [Lachnospiraceae bacterium]
MNNIGAMYGKEGAFFHKMPKEFGNYIWMELIGFDNEKDDCGVEDFLATAGFVPAGIFLLVTSIDIINTHQGLNHEYELDEFFCSYAGHPYNDERARQRWTNYQLKKLVSALRKHGIESYISIFDFVSPKKEFPHTEIYTTAWLDGKAESQSCVYMTKRFSDGSFYEDFFLASAIKLLGDYGFDGIHLADGVCRPRYPLQWADMSDDMLAQAGITIPDGEDRANFIAKNKRNEWITFCTLRWGQYLKKVVCGIHEAGFKVAVNSTWTKDPMEAEYRYGVDYKMLSTLPIDLCVAENGAPTICMIDTPSNAGYKQSYEERKTVHHAFRASLMLIGVCMQDMKLVPLYPVRDTLEQYDVVHHLPTALPKHSAAIFSSFEWRKEGLVPIISGNTFCLGDGLSADNWRYLRLCADNAYVEKVSGIPGATIIWSDERNKKEIAELISHRTPSTHRLLTLILRRGAAVFKTAHIDNLECVKGDILVTNPHLLPEDELEKIKNYTDGRIIYLSADKVETYYSAEFNPSGVGFPYPLYYADASEDTLINCVNEINEGLCYISDEKEACRVQEIVTGEKTSRYIVTNDEYYYTRPVVHTGRTIKSATDITKVRGYNTHVNEDTFSVLVPLMGAAIVEVEFE